MTGLFFDRRSGSKNKPKVDFDEVWRGETRFKNIHLEEHVVHQGTAISTQITAAQNADTVLCGRIRLDVVFGDWFARFSVI